jgi:hypothetical protein
LPCRVLPPRAGDIDVIDNLGSHKGKAVNAAIVAAGALDLSSCLLTPPTKGASAHHRRDRARDRPTSDTQDILQSEMITLVAAVFEEFVAEKRRKGWQPVRFLEIARPRAGWWMRERKSRPVTGALEALLDFDPNAVTPVTVAFVLAPPELLVVGPFPVVWTDGEPEIGMIVVPLDVPAIALGIARDFC